MKFLVPLFASFSLFVSSVSGLSTFVNISGSTQNITTIWDTTGENLHSYSGINLAPSAYLAEVDLFEAKLVDADLSDADLTGAILARAFLTHAHLTGAFLSNADLSYTSLYGADFRGADLRGADLRYADLRYADFRGADFGYADLTGAYVNGVWGEFIGSNFITGWADANLYGASLPNGYDQAWFESKGATFVPEPSSYALLLGSLALGLVAFRRR